MVTVKVDKGKIFMICINQELGTKKHGAEHFKNHNNGKEFFFHCMIILLGVSQLFGPICNREFELDNDGIHLIIRGVGVNVKGYVMVWVCHEDIHSQDYFHVFEGSIHFRGPTKGFLPDLSERGLNK